MSERWEYRETSLNPADGVDEQFKLVLLDHDHRLAEFIVCRHHRHGQSEVMVDLTIFASVNNRSLEDVYEKLMHVPGVTSDHCTLLYSIKDDLVEESSNLVWEIIQEILEDDVEFIKDGSADRTYTNTPVDEEDREELEEKLRRVMGEEDVLLN